MKKNYIMPRITVVELMEEGMIAQSQFGGTVKVIETETVEGGNGLVREEVTFPKHDVWNEW